MIKVYIVSSINSGRQVIKWLEEHNLSYVKRTITRKNPLRVAEIKKILFLTENGFDDLINIRSRKYKELGIDICTYTTEELINIIIENPTIIKSPIVLNKKKIIIGYNKEEMRVLLPRNYKIAVKNMHMLASILNEDIPEGRIANKTGNDKYQKKKEKNIHNGKNI